MDITTSLQTWNQLRTVATGIGPPGTQHFLIVPILPQIQPGPTQKQRKHNAWLQCKPAPAHVFIGNNRLSSSPVPISSFAFMGKFLLGFLFVANILLL